MKQQRFRYRILTLVIIGFLGVAGLYGIYSVSTYGNRWFANANNIRYRAAKSNVIAGNILDRNGVILASTNSEGERVYQADKQSRSSTVHLLGDVKGYIANGVESFQANYLYGFETSLSERISALIKGEARRGDNVQLTIDSRLHTVIVELFQQQTASGRGAAVVMNYLTGEVLALVSLPVFDPHQLDDSVKNNPDHPFFNRATQSILAPGSTFKIVTAVAAIDNIEHVLNSTFNCTGATPVMHLKIHDYNQEKHGPITLEDAFRLSCNNTFAQIALMIGDNKLRKTAEQFGFNNNFLFRDIVVENGIYPKENRNDIEIAWSGAGQSRVATTPFHMCLVSAAIANSGEMMEPRLLKKVTSPSGLMRLDYSQNRYMRVTTKENATLIEEWMKEVVARGTGTNAKVKGVTVAGKTGSAESTMKGKPVTHAWFTGFITNRAYPYAVCVMVEEGGSGGKVAAPIAGDILGWLLAHQ